MKRGAKTKDNHFDHGGFDVEAEHENSLKQRTHGCMQEEGKRAGKFTNRI